jgi:small-conductance mechanosensitive channel
MKLIFESNRSLPSRVLLYLLLCVVIGFVAWYSIFDGQAQLVPLFPSLPLTKIVYSLLILVGVTVSYVLGVIYARGHVIKSKGIPGEVKMLKNALKFFLVLMGFILFIWAWFSVGAIGTLFFTFGGMFLGWSLQAPISGVAAWMLISIMRPFRVGDRIQLPSFGLVGDVVDVSALYTTLNQVGGSVGSEEPADRTILIPNAMLFGALVINYTPKHQDELIRQSHSHNEKKDGDISSYMLDEFVLRLTFDSDWDEAERILLETAREVTANIIQETGEQPYIRADMADWYGVFMRLRFLTNATMRPKIIHEISKRVFKAIQGNDKVDFAIPYIYSDKKGQDMAPPMSIRNMVSPSGAAENATPRSSFENMSSLSQGQE